MKARVSIPDDGRICIVGFVVTTAWALTGKTKEKISAARVLILQIGLCTAVLLANVSTVWIRDSLPTEKSVTNKFGRKEQLDLQQFCHGSVTESVLLIVMGGRRPHISDGTGDDYISTSGEALAL
ncbi:hypothetical protein Tco_0741945, partial [Tanacetum coccineum]